MRKQLMVVGVIVIAIASTATYVLSTESDDKKIFTGEWVVTKESILKSYRSSDTSIECRSEFRTGAGIFMGSFEMFYDADKDMLRNDATLVSYNPAMFTGSSTERMTRLVNFESGEFYLWTSNIVDGEAELPERGVYRKNESDLDGPDLLRQLDYSPRDVTRTPLECRKLTVTGNLMTPPEEVNFDI
jgi:hypothetical protein